MVLINARVLLAVAEPINSVFINVQANMEAGARWINMCFWPIADYPQFILNEYQEVGQKTAHTATPKEERATATVKRWRDVGCSQNQRYRINFLCVIFLRSEFEKVKKSYCFLDLWFVVMWLKFSFIMIVMTYQNAKSQRYRNYKMQPISRQFLCFLAPCRSVRLSYNEFMCRNTCFVIDAHTCRT